MNQRVSESPLKLKELIETLTLLLSRRDVDRSNKYWYYRFFLNNNKKFYFQLKNSNWRNGIFVYLYKWYTLDNQRIYVNKRSPFISSVQTILAKCETIIWVKVRRSKRDVRVHRPLWRRRNREKGSERLTRALLPARRKTYVSLYHTAAVLSKVSPPSLRMTSSRTLSRDR